MTPNNKSLSSFIAYEKFFETLKTLQTEICTLYGGIKMRHDRKDFVDDGYAFRDRILLKKCMEARDKLIDVDNFFNTGIEEL